MRQARHVVRVWEERNTQRFLVRKRDVKSTFGRTSHSWRDIRTSQVAVGRKNLKWYSTSTPIYASARILRYRISVVLSVTN